MAYQTTFVSSEKEEKRRRNLLSGSRSFSFMGNSYYYVYSPKLISLKERIVERSFQMENLLNDLGKTIKEEYIHSALLEEVSSSCVLDGYPYLKRLENLYLKKKGFALLERDFPLKNLSLKAGFSISSPCKDSLDIRTGLEELSVWNENKRGGDLLIEVLIEHFLFEVIHPYRDMNGLMGRYSIHSELKSSIYRFLGSRFSFYFSKCPKMYFVSFKRAQTTNNINDYLELLLEYLLSGLEGDLHDLADKKARWEDGLAKVSSLDLKGGEKETLEGILMMRIFKKQKLNLSRLALILGKSERTVFRHASNVLKIDI